LRALRIAYYEKILEIRLFSSLQILDIYSPPGIIKILIPYLASKFTKKHFERMQINFIVENFNYFIED